MNPRPIEPRARIPLAAHVALAGWTLGFLGLARARPQLYHGLLQEDRFVEWLTVALFAAAAAFALRRAWRERRAFDALVGAFCGFVAGEEFSWGQRLLGITPPDVFLEHNRQQELTLHNFADVFGEPRWVLILALAGFGLALPAIARLPRGARLLDRVGASAPPVLLVPWLALAAALLLWYPHPFTGEWVEALAGGAFLLSFAPAAGAALVATAIGAVAALGMATLSGSAREATPAELACARAETQALVQDLAHGTAATGRLIGARSVHKRIHTAIAEGYVRPERLVAFRDAPCPGDGDAAERRTHAIDPWSTAYWVDLERSDDAIDLAVYSFGPNRRRDRDAAGAAADDVVAHVRITTGR